MQGVTRPDAGGGGYWRTGRLLLFLLQCLLVAGQTPPWPCLQNHAQCQTLLDSANNATAKADIQTYCRETGAYVQCLTSDLADCDPQTITMVQTTYLDNIQLSLTTVCGRVEEFQCLQNWSRCEELFTQQNQFLNQGDYANYCRVGQEYLACMEADLQDCGNATEALHRQNYVTGVQASLNVTCHGDPSIVMGSAMPYVCASGLGVCLTNLTTANMNHIDSYCSELHEAMQCITRLMETCNHPDVTGTLTSYQTMESQFCAQNGDAQCSARWSLCAEPLLPVLQGFDINASSNYTLMCSALETALLCMQNSTAGCTSQALQTSSTSYLQMQQQFCGDGPSYQQCHQSLQQCQMEASAISTNDPHSMCSAAQHSLQCLERVLQQCPGIINLTAHAQAVEQVCSAANTQCAATYACFQSMNDKIQTGNLSIACMGYAETLACLDRALQSCGWRYNGSLSFSQLSQTFQRTCSILTSFYSCQSTATCMATLSPMASLEDNYRPDNWCRLLRKAVNCSKDGSATCGTTSSSATQLQLLEATLHPCTSVLPSETYHPPEMTSVDMTTSELGRSTTTAFVTGSPESSPTYLPPSTPASAPSSSAPLRTINAPPRTTGSPVRPQNDIRATTSLPVSADRNAAVVPSGMRWLWVVAVLLAVWHHWS